MYPGHNGYNGVVYPGRPVVVASGTTYIVAPVAPVVTMVAPPIAPVILAAPPPIYVAHAFATPSYVLAPAAQIAYAAPVAHPTPVRLVMNPPLPAGWEAMMDPVSKRTYYVNHSMRTTSWTDPRQQKPQQQQPQQPPQYTPQPQQPQRDTTYQYGHRFCAHCGIEVTMEASTCICGKPLHN